MKRLALATLCCLLCGLASAQAGEPATVVELFTSQGCASCPPAEALLGRLATRPDLLALSLHVDYWDAFGWKDAYALPAASARQRRYVAQFRLHSVYTPQIVVDGGWQAVGSDPAEVARALAAAARHRRRIPVRLAADAGMARVEIAADRRDEPAAIVLVGFDLHHQTSVEAGENAGRTLVETDVVRGLDRIGWFNGAAMMLAAPIRWPCERVAVLLQRADGRIVGAAVADPAAK